MPMLSTLAYIGNLNPIEIILILGLALLLFGKRLPEVGRSLGKGIVEFKKGLKDIHQEVEQQTAPPATPPVYRAPITDGQDPRVARSPAYEQPAPAPMPVQTSEQAPANPQL